MDMRMVLDFAVVAVPTAVGLASWLMPVKEITNRHRWALLAGGVLLSLAIFWQQSLSRSDSKAVAAEQAGTVSALNQKIDLGNAVQRSLQDQLTKSVEQQRDMSN